MILYKRYLYTCILVTSSSHTLATDSPHEIHLGTFRNSHELLLQAFNQTPPQKFKCRVKVLSCMFGPLAWSYSHSCLRSVCILCLNGSLVGVSITASIASICVCGWRFPRCTVLARVSMGGFQSWLMFVCFYCVHARVHVVCVYVCMPCGCCVSLSISYYAGY